MNTNSSRCIVALCAVALYVFAPSVSHADTASSGPLVFQTQNQDMWGSGGAFNFSASHDFRFPTDGDFGGSFSGGGISCGFLGCFGATVSGVAAGNIGLGLNANVNGGSVRASTFFDVTLGFPNSVEAGTFFNVTNSIAPLPQVSLLQTASPSIQASSDLSGGIRGGLKGNACLFACTGEQIIVDEFSRSGAKTLFSLDSTTTPPQTINLGNAVSLTVQSPFVSTFGVGFGNTVTSSGSSKFLGLDADITNLVTDIFGLPPLHGGVHIPFDGDISYSLLDVTAGLDVNTTQAFTLKTDPQIVYRVSFIGDQPDVIAKAVSLNSAEPLTLSIPIGDIAAIITPTYVMNAELTNATGLDFRFNTQISGLSLDGVGPLFDESSDLDVARFSVFNAAFPLTGWNSIQGVSFRVNVTAIPEPMTIFLLGSGLMGLAGMGGQRLRRRRRNAAQ